MADGESQAAASAEARIPTEHASRYLQQLCKHWSHKFEVTFTPEEGRIPFANGAVCILNATPDTLVLKVETSDADSLARMEDVVINHLKRFAFREDLGDVRWELNRNLRAIASFSGIATEIDMADRYEERVVRDADGRVIEQVEVNPRKRGGGGFGWGMLVGLLVIAAAVIVFAYSQGSFQTAGAQADQATAQAESTAGTLAENAGDAAEQAGDNVKSATN